MDNKPIISDSTNINEIIVTPEIVGDVQMINHVPNDLKRIYTVLSQQLEAENKHKPKNSRKKQPTPVKEESTIVRQQPTVVRPAVPVVNSALPVVNPALPVVNATLPVVNQVRPVSPSITPNTPQSSSSDDDYTEDDFWSTISSLNWRDRSDGALNFPSIITSHPQFNKIFVEKTKSISDVLNNTQMDKKLISQISKHIVLRGLDFYKTTMECPDFALYLDTEYQLSLP